MLLSLLLIACAEPTDSGKDTTAPEDTGETAETGETGDSTETTEATLSEIRWAVAPSDVDTRTVLHLQVTASWSDGTETDATADTTWSSSDEAVLKFYTPGVGQPLDAGTTSVRAEYGGMELSGDVTVTLAVIQELDVVFNEVLADGTLDGDPNGDGVLDPVEDEFVELANASDVTVDLGGCSLVEDDFPDLPRHTFPAGTLLHAGEAIVVFGGGDVSSLSADNVTFVTVSNGDVGLQYGLSLNNEGEQILLVDPAGASIARFQYGPDGLIDAIEDASMVLSPDVDGASYTNHTYATGSIGDFSAGTFVDGSAFPGPDGRY